MTRKFLIGCFLLGVLISSCQKSIIEKLPIANKSLREKVLAFMDAKKAKVGDAAKNTIESLKSKIEWADFTVATSAAFNQKQTVFKIKKENTENRLTDNTYSCLYVLQNANGNIQNVSTLEISIPNGDTTNLNGLAINLVNNDMGTYSGALVRKNLSGYYIYEVDISNGVPSAYKYLKKKNPSGKSGLIGRTEQCIEWYWQTYVNGVLVSEIFLFEDCSNGVEEGSPGGSGGGGGSNPDSTIAPCDKVDSLNADSGFQAYMSALHSVTDSNYEVGFVKGHGGLFGNITYQMIQGNPNNPYLPSIIPTSPIDGVFHSHFGGGFSIFSPQDLRYLYTLYSGGLANQGFTYAVTTQGGTYVLQVTNMAAFLTYGQAHLQDSVTFDEFQLATYSTYNIWESGSGASNETGFLQMLQNENMGLTLLSSSSNSNFSEWNVKGIFSGTPMIVPCL